jgi:hypothetical protein
LDNHDKFLKIEDEGVIMNLLSGANARKSEVFIWKFFGNLKHIGQVKIEYIRKSRKDFCISPFEGQDQIIHNLIYLQDWVDLYIPESLALLRCKLKSVDSPNRYFLKFPIFAGHVERRKSLRLNVYDSSEVKLAFTKSLQLANTINQRFSKDCFDLSSGGFSFLVSKMELKYFQINETIQNIELKASDFTITVSASIRSLLEVEPDEYNNLPYKVWRVNCAFISIDKNSQKFLEKFIFERIKTDLSAINNL